MARFPALHTLPATATLADRLTWDLEKAEGWDRYWRHGQFARVPESFQAPVAEQYRAMWGTSERAANLFLLSLTDRLGALAIDPTTTDDDLIALAKRIAFNCREVLSQAKPHHAAATQLLRICTRYGIRPPQGLQHFVSEAATPPGSRSSAIQKRFPVTLSISVPGTTPGTVPDTGTVPVTNTGTVPVTDTVRGSPARLAAPTISRLTDDTWWRRKLRVVHGRLFEAEAIRLQRVHRYAGRYVSEATFIRHQQQRRRNARVLANLVAENESGDTLPLAELVDTSLANPRNRHAELMVRIYGFDQLALELGHGAVMLTVTCPSRMHACAHAGGTRNPRFDPDITPRVAQQYLSKLWSRIRAKWQRQGLRPYGFRVTEAHHDGTPHWHVLLFIAPEQLDAMVATVRAHALADSPNEPGAAEHRFRVEHIDRRKGSATGYIAKYIAKSIDGKGLSTTEGEPSPASLAQRISAWSSNWGIRQFQQIGGPPVSLWRECRRAPHLASSPTLIGPLSAAADRGDWADFVRLLGGPQQARQALPVSLEKVEDHRLGRYGDILGPRVVGLSLGNVVFSTRFHTWEIKRKTAAQNCTLDSLPSTAITPTKNEEGESLSPSPPWSSVNNCTPTAFMRTRRLMDVRSFEIYLGPPSSVYRLQVPDCIP